MPHRSHWAGWAADGTSAGNMRGLRSGHEPDAVSGPAAGHGAAGRGRGGPPGSGRRRPRRAAAIAVVIAVVLVAGSVWWAVAAPGTYGRSHAGCVTASVPSTTGGGLMHACGNEARSLCRVSFTRTDRLSRALRPQCRGRRAGPRDRLCPGREQRRLAPATRPWGPTRTWAGLAPAARALDRPKTRACLEPAAPPILPPTGSSRRH